MGMVRWIPRTILEYKYFLRSCWDSKVRMFFQFFLSFFDLIPCYFRIFFPSNVLIIIKFHHKKYEVSLQFIVIDWDIIFNGVLMRTKRHPLGSCGGFILREDEVILNIEHPFTCLMGSLTNNFLSVTWLDFNAKLSKIYVRLWHLITTQFSE